MKKKHTIKELMKMSSEEMAAYFLEKKSIYYQTADMIQDSNYESYTSNEKIDYWYGRLHSSMRRQAESGLNEYTPFDQLWYEAVKKQEPNIDNIIDIVFNKFENNMQEWSKEAFLERIRAGKKRG